jgi:hypothetical protein
VNSHSAITVTINCVSPHGEAAHSKDGKSAIKICKDFQEIDSITSIRVAFDSIRVLQMTQGKSGGSPSECS